jgi:thioesterase domain-containing protein
MNSTFYTTILAYLLFSITGMYAQDKSVEKSNDLVLVKVASLNTVDANKEFQKNVQLVQQQRALAAEVLSKLEASENKDEKVQLKTQFDSLQKKLNENNQLMFKTYGFSLNRNYVLTVEKSHIHMWVTAEEAEAIRNKSSSVEPEVKEKEKTGFRSLFNRKK